MPIDREKAARYSKPIGTKLTSENVAAVEARVNEAQRARNLDPAERARRAEDILPPVHHIAGAVTKDKIRRFIEDRYGFQVSSIAIVFIDGGTDYIVPPPISPL